MPNIKSNAADKANDLSDQMIEFFQGIERTTQPVVIAGVQRKINIGNFENIDVYCAASLPIDISHCTSDEQIAEVIERNLDDLIHITSKKTGEKYLQVKNAGKESE